MANIQFHKIDDTSFLPKNRLKLRKWLNAVAKGEKQQIKDLSYIFCTDAHLHKMNVQFLQHDEYTDVITFENTREKGQIEGEIYISYERVKENAAEYSLSTTNELHRVMVHGLLHLLGYKDKTPVSKKEMTRKEDFYLNLQAEI